MIPYARTAAHAREPQVEDAGFAQARHHTRKMQNQRNAYDPEALENEKAFRRHDAVDNEETIGDAREHLWASERKEHRLALQLIGHALARQGSRANATDDAGRTEQNEAAQDDNSAMAPIDPAIEHHEAHRCDGNHRCYGCNCAHQGSLNPVDSSNNRTRAFWVRSDLRHSANVGQYECCNYYW